MNDKLSVCVVGGGNSAHTLIPLLKHAGHKVSLLTRRPNAWSKTLSLKYTPARGELLGEIHTSIDVVSSRPEDIVPLADAVILCMPVSGYRSALHRIAPHVPKDRKTYIGTIYGQAGFNWMVNEVVKKHGLDRVVTFACGLIPWIARTETYGKVGITYGPKSRNVAAVSPQSEFDTLNTCLFNDLCLNWFHTGAFEQAENFISLSLSVDNQIIHTSRLFSLSQANGGVWPTREAVPLFYRDYDDASAQALKELDDDFSAIRRNLISRFPDRDFRYMLDYLALERLSYGSSNTDIKASFVNSQTLGAIDTPVVPAPDGSFTINRDHRFFTDDIYYGLCPAKWIAQKMAIRTPMIDKILRWAGSMLDVTLIDDENHLVKHESDDPFKFGTPDEYGIETVEELID